MKTPNDRTSQASQQDELVDFLRQLPKAELHVHIEGTLEPELMFTLAERNGVSLPYRNVAELRAAYDFQDLGSFLELYYAGAQVLITKQDFYDMTWAYLQRAHEDGIVHTEIMFDPQTHTRRGIALETVFAGIADALRDAHRRWGLSSRMILSFLRDLSEQDAFITLNKALPLRQEYGDLWTAIGLDSAELGNLPEKFVHVFAQCAHLGFRLVAHAGEEGPAEYVHNALDVLHVERIDHGVRSEEDPALLHRIIDNRIPMTVCPLSNIRLGVFPSMADHSVVRLLRRGATVTLNSDDPAYFGGYLVDNFLACVTELGLTRDECRQLARNSIQASFLPDDAKQALLSAQTAEQAYQHNTVL